MKSYLKFLWLLLLLLAFIEAYAQNLPEAISPEKEAHRISIGTRFGRTLVHLDTRMRSHNRFGATLQLPVGKEFLWDLDMEFYDACGVLGARTFEYKAYTLVVRNVQHVTAYTLDLAVAKRNARFASTGVGLSLEYFSVETIVNNKTYPFYIDVRTDEIVPWGEETQLFRFLSPGLFILGDLHYPLGNSLQIYLAQKTKVAYVGKNYHAHPLDSWITFTVYTGVRFKIKSEKKT
jgi:hypothetical protein